MGAPSEARIRAMARLLVRDCRGREGADVIGLLGRSRRLDPGSADRLRAAMAEIHAAAGPPGPDESDTGEFAPITGGPDGTHAGD